MEIMLLLQLETGQCANGTVTYLLVKNTMLGYDGFEFGTLHESIDCLVRENKLRGSDFEQMGSPTVTF